MTNPVNMLVGALGCLGDVFTDAPEMAASVAEAENVIRLAQRLMPSGSPLILSGSLLADGKPVAEAWLTLGGRLVGGPALGCEAYNKFERDSTWCFATKEGEHFPLDVFVREYDEEFAWVVADVGPLHNRVLSLS